MLNVGKEKSHISELRDFDKYPKWTYCVFALKSAKINKENKKIAVVNFLPFLETSILPHTNDFFLSTAFRQNKAPEKNRTCNNNKRFYTKSGP